MEKKLAIVVGCLAIYLVLKLILGKKIDIILMIGLLGFGIYKVSK